MAFPAMPQRPTQRGFLAGESSVEVREWQDQQALDLVPPPASGNQLRHLGLSLEAQFKQESRIGEMGNSPLAVAGGALVMQLNRVSQSFHERSVVERLAQEADRSVVERTSPVFVVCVCGNQNYRRVISPRLQLFLQVKTA